MSTAAAITEAELPNNRILFRSKEGVEVYSIPSSANPTPPSSASSLLSSTRPFLLRGATTFHTFSPNGHFVYLHQPNIGVVRCSLNENVNNIKLHESTAFLADSQHVQIMTVSPLGTFLLTWERYRAPTATTNSSGGGGGGGGSSSGIQEGPANLKVWNAATGAFVWGTIQKNLKREGWPYMQWTHDEKFAMIMTSNELRVYQGQDLVAIANDNNSSSNTNGTSSLRYVDQIRCPGVVSFSFPDVNNPNKALMPTAIETSTSYYFTCFCTKTKDQPARISLHVYPPPPQASSSASVTAAKKTTSTNYPALVFKPSHQADECHIHWNPKGDACLASLSTSVDTSGESYYGSSTLLLLRHDASEAILVPLPNASTNPSVSDVSWMPNPHTPPCFLVISGKMPTTTSLHHGVTADPLYMLGQGHRNTSAWAPHGRFFALAGFGNLAGGVTFWDRNKLKPMESPVTGDASGITAPCTVGWGWSSDSRLIFTSITSPRRNVDNGVRIFRYNGVELTHVMPWNNAQFYQPDKLLAASFVPTDVSYPDRPQSPKPRRLGGATTETATATTAGAVTQPMVTAPVAAAPAKAKYVPPSARGRASDGSSLAERMRRQAETTSLVATKAVAVTAKPSVVGMAPVKKTIPGLNPPSASSGSKKSKKPKPKVDAAASASATTGSKDVKAAPEVAAPVAATVPPPAEAVETDPEKRARKVKKMLKQIEDLKARPASELNEDQQKKVASEAQLREELIKLGF